MGKKSPAPPPAPDYATLAIKQGEANLAAAKQSAYMSNPNIYSPTGSQTVTWTKTPTVDTDAYNKALEGYQNRLAQYGYDAAGDAPTQEQFTTYIEQPTVRQTVSPEAEQALRAQEQAQLYMSQAARGAAQGLSALGIASAFRPSDIPALNYTIGDFGTVAKPQDITQLGSAQGVSAIQGAAATPTASAYGTAGAGPAAPTLGQFGYSGPGVNYGPSGGGLYGMAGAGPQGLNLQGLDLSGLGGVSGGPQQGQFGYAAQYVPGAELQRQIDVNELPQAPINAGMTAQQAILSRLSPQLTGERQQLQTQLINQGLRPGGEAYNAAMMGQAQKENDLMLQAAAQGISIDQAARQQAFNEQQSRAMFANQAALSGFGMGMEQAGLYNTGLGQNLQNALATQAAQNQAQQQAFQQRLQTGEFGREAQLASFGTQQQAQQAQNQAIAQNFQQQLAAQEAQNQAQQQAYAQQLGTAGFNREALLSQFGMGQQAQEAANQAIAQNYQQALAQQQAENAARQQIFQQSVAQQELGNQALAQRQGAVMDYFGALNAAQQQAYQQALAQAQFRNTAAQQALAQQAAIRSIPVNEISALMSGGQVSVPQFQGYSGVTVAPAPIFQGGQAQDAAAMQRYGIAANQAASNTSGLFGLAGQIGSAALLASDRRLKSNIVRIGTHPLGIGIYEYDIFGERQRGVMAQELEQVMPEAVVEHPAGFKMVNYALL